MITVNLPEVWLGITDKGFFPIEGEGVGDPLSFRLEVTAVARDSWSVDAVSLVETQIISQSAEGCRTAEIVTPIEGKFGKELADFFYRSESFAAEIQEKVNFHIVPDVSWTYHEAGRTM